MTVSTKRNHIPLDVISFFFFDCADPRNAHHFSASRIIPGFFGAQKEKLKSPLLISLSSCNKNIMKFIKKETSKWHVQKKYLKSLEDQIIDIDIQIEQLKDEITNLRAKRRQLMAEKDQEDMKKIINMVKESGKTPAEFLVAISKSNIHEQYKKNSLHQRVFLLG